MTVCAVGLSNVECALQYSNLYDIKLIVLLTIFILSCAMFYYSFKIDQEASLFNWFSFLIMRFLPLIYIFGFVFALSTLLNYNITYEIFMLIIAAFYLINISLLIGLAILFKQDLIFRIFGISNLGRVESLFKFRNGKKR